jgi:uncharacterized protein involved in exopolysaccharide biosynthesis
MFKRFWWMLFAMLPVGALIGLMVAAVATYQMRKVYESVAVIEVKPRGPMDGEAPAQGVEPGRFFATEMEKITSRNSLEKVVDALTLGERWNVDRETAVLLLKKSVTVQNISGTDLISIRARHTDKTDARDIAEAIPHAYKAYYAEIEVRDAERYLQELNKMVRTQEDKVEEKRKVLSLIVRNKGPSARTEDQDYADAKTEFEMEQDLLQSMKLKQMEKSISGRIPGESVMIHEAPVIAQTPVSPRVTYNLLAGSVLGLFLSPLMALPLMWIMSRRKSAVA